MKLQLTDGSSIEMRFDMYFLSRVSKMTGKMLHELPYYLIGDNTIDDQGIISGSSGVLVDLECRAAVLAGSIDSANQLLGNPTQSNLIDGFEIMNNIPSTFTNEVWGSIFTELIRVMIPEASQSEKKSAAKRANRSTGGNSKASA